MFIYIYKCICASVDNENYTLLRGNQQRQRKTRQRRLWRTHPVGSALFLEPTSDLKELLGCLGSVKLWVRASAGQGIWTGRLGSLELKPSLMTYNGKFGVSRTGRCKYSRKCMAQSEQSSTQKRNMILPVLPSVEQAFMHRLL